MNKTGMYILFTLLSVLMVTACTLEGDIFTIQDRAKISSPSSSKVPGVPSDVTATAASSSSITVKWSLVSSASGYYVYRSSTRAGTYAQVGISTTTSYTDTGLSANTTYYYKVAAYNSAGTGAQSSYVSATTSSISTPNTPTGVITSDVTSNSVTISWNSVSGATGYYIYRSSTPAGSNSQVGSSTTTSYTDTGLSAGTTYYYTVAAYNSAGTGSQSLVVSVKTISMPSAPTGVTTSGATSNSVTISWNPVSGATGYYVYRSSTFLGTYTQVGNSTTTSYTNTGLSAGTTYYYTVAAYNSEGTGSQSSYVSVTTTGFSVPSAPTGVIISGTTSNSVTISWNPVSGATGYYIYYADNYQLFSTTTTSYTISLSADTTYYFTVAAYNSAGTGPQSSSVSVRL